MGLRLGSAESYGYAVAHPLLVLGINRRDRQGFGALDLSGFDPGKAMINVAILVAATFVMAIITEEGFFRGWLWAALDQARSVAAR